MNAARGAVAAILFGSFLLCPARDPGHVQDDQWKNLMHADRRPTYTVVTRQLGCTVGKIDAVTRQTVTLKRPDGTTESIAKQDVLRSTDQEIASLGIVYSGRSSWLDVKNCCPNPKRYSGVYLRLVMLDGKKHEGELVGVQDTNLTLRDGRQTNQFAKLDISRVYLVRYKRMSKSAEAAFTELFVFKVLDPQLWPYFLRIGTAYVLLYDSRMPDDDSEIDCKQIL